MPRNQTALRATLAVSLAVTAACSELSSDPAAPDLGSAETSAQIQAVRDAAVAADVTGLSLPIEGAFVTYVRPAAIAGDVAGFFLQSQRPGPALFVAVDPASLVPTPKIGDQLDLTVTSVRIVDGRLEAYGVDGGSYARVAEGASVATLQQELSTAADLVGGLDGYESELATITGVLRDDLTGAGDGFATAGLSTAALAAEPNLVFRLPVELRALHDLTLGCRVTVAGTPLWRGLNGALPVAQVTAWTAADLDVEACPAPRVLSAAALSPTTVVVAFDRILDADSALTDGSQFSIDGDLAVTAAAVTAAREVTLTTGAQASGTAYTLTVAPSVADLYGAPIDAAYDAAPFTGWAEPARLRLSELYVATSGAGRVELEVVTGGTVHDALLRSGDGTAGLLATLPDLVLATGEVVVVHLEPAPGVVTETLSSGDCTDAACHAGAWDVAGVLATNLKPSSSHVVMVETASGSIQDAVPFTDRVPTGTAAFVADLEALQAADPSLWTLCAAPVTGDPVACASTEDFLAISVSWVDMAEGTSIARTAVADTDTSADWAAVPASFGSLPND